MDPQTTTTQPQPGLQHRIVLVRHGKPKIDENISRAQWSLSSSGLQAVKMLGEILKKRNFTFERIISSPETKAVQTAQAISTSLGKDSVVIDSDFSEHSRAQSDFLSQKDFQAGISRLFSADPTTLVFGQETANAAVDRFRSAIQRQIQSSVTDVVVVTHGTILSPFIGRTLGIDALQFWCDLGFSTAVVLCGDGLEIIETMGQTCSSTAEDGSAWPDLRLTGSFRNLNT